MISLFLYPVILLMGLSAATAESPRQAIDLTGLWDIASDEQDEGLDAGWFRSDAAASDTIAWQPIFVPSTWETVLGNDFDTIAWYTKKAGIPEAAAQGRVWLRFLGVATEARVWVNGREAGEHLGAWTAFTLDITDRVTPGEEARIVVRVDEKVGHNTQGFLPIIAPHFGGIWQKVELILTSAASIDDLALCIDPSRVRIDDSRLRVDASQLQADHDANAAANEEEATEEARTLSWEEAQKGEKAPMGTPAIADLAMRIPVLGNPGPGASVRLTLFRDEEALPGEVSAQITEGEDHTFYAPLNWRGEVLLWDAGQPNLYALRVELLDGNRRVLDSVIRYTGFRNVRAQGKKIMLNGRPLSVRGCLSWGHYPPMLAPRPPKAEFLKRLKYLHACGFNLIKFCLWLPPEEYLDMVDATGMLAWIEYPTWHPKLDATHRDELLREYGEMAMHDHSHPSVIFRSVTCETGPSADPDVIQALYDLVKAHAPGTLVEDDSSWIQWNRIHDFWDDHSYGNNRTWRDKLRALDAYRTEHGVMPLLLGEAIAADTWIDTKEFRNTGAIERNDAGEGERNKMGEGERPWWWPRWLDDQIAFEAKLRTRFSDPDFDPVEDVVHTSLKYAMDMRQWQIETFRDQMPHAGYVVSVIQDVRLCAMGLLDPFSKPKWPTEAWTWHRERSGALITPHDQRALRASQPFDCKVSIHQGAGDEDARSAAGLTPYPEKPEKPFPFSAYWEENGRRKATWEMWALPEPAPRPEGTMLYGAAPDGYAKALFPEARRLKEGEPIPGSAPALVAFALSRPLLDYIEAGGRVLHITTGMKRAFKTAPLWFLRGTAWAPPEPASFFDAVPRNMLSYLQLFELGGNAVVRGDLLWDQVDPLLAHLETHDLDRVRPNLLLFDTRVGKGRLMVSALRHEGGAGENYAGLWLARALLDYLVSGPAPERGLDEETLDALRTSLDEEIILLDKPWRFAKDPQNKGVDEGWFKTDYDDSGWESLRARSDRENEIWYAYDGWAWYRDIVEIPASWEGKPIRLVSDSVDDMYELYVNGQKAGAHGKIDRSETSFLKRTWVDLTPFVKAGEPALLVFRVHDWVGGGGLNGEAFLTTGPVEKRMELLVR